MRYVILAGLLFSAALLAAPVSVSGVDFAPSAAVRLQQEYGEDQAATLQSAIRTAVSRETGCARLPAGFTVTVTVRDLAPTHPTRRQSADNPSLDVLRTRYLGGADLVGEVRDANQRVLTTVAYRHFARTLALGSYSSDPWGDARLAIDGFAARLGAACRNLPPS